MRMCLAAMMVVLATPALAFSVCGQGWRHDCVVDGDTLWIEHEKVRLVGIDTAEMEHPRCGKPGPMARAAQARLWQLMQATPIRIERTGTDRYRRTLGRVFAGGIDVGQQLLAEGLARVYVPGEKPWCE